MFKLKVLQHFRNFHEPDGPFCERGKLMVREALSQDGVVIELENPEKARVTSAILEPEEAKKVLAELNEIIQKWVTDPEVMP